MDNTDKVLTLQELKDAEPNSIIRSGYFEYSFRWELPPEKHYYVAVRWKVHDWAIYSITVEIPIHIIAKIWDKIHDKSLVPQIVKCDEEALDFYRNN